MNTNNDELKKQLDDIHIGSVEMFKRIEINKGKIDDIKVELNQIKKVIKPKRGRPQTAWGLSKDPIYVKEYNKERYERDRLKLLENSKEKVYCECCNKDVSKGNLSKHKKSRKHDKAIIEELKAQRDRGNKL